MVPQNCHLSSQNKRKGSESIALATKQNKTNRERQTTMERMQTNMTKKTRFQCSPHKNNKEIAIPHKPQPTRSLRFNILPSDAFCGKISHSGYLPNFPKTPRNTAPATKTYPPTSAKISKSTNSARLPQN